MCHHVLLHYPTLQNNNQPKSIQKMDQEIPQFHVHRATTRPIHTCPYKPILKACTQLQNQLVEHQLYKAVNDLLNVCKIEYASGVQGQIFPVQLHKNQEQQLEPFLILLEQELQERKETIFPIKQGRMQIEERQVGERIQVVFLNSSQIRDIVLHMYIFLEEHPQHQLVVFIARQITDLCQQNLYCFEKALKSKRFISVLSTFSTFQNESESLSHIQYEKYHISLYHPKDLFCEFVYKSIAMSNIKAYLPDGILTLISDMDYYSLSFRESCRRFSYCLERSLMLVQKERTWVDFDSLIMMIEDVISKKFKLYCGYKNSLEKILKVILKQHENYIISEKAVSLEVAMGAHFTPAIDENDIMNSIRESLQKHLNSKSQFKTYSSYLIEDQDQPILQRKKKKSRYDLLGIDTKKNLTPKTILQNQITKIIKQATFSIRAQAELINWQQIYFELRIRPQIPVLIISSMQQDNQIGELVEQILSDYASPISKYIDGWDKKDIGRLNYLLKTLDISGLTEMNKKNQKYSICRNFFEKTIFSGGHR